MNQSAKSWLLFMMIPFFIGVIIYFVVPLQMIIAANPKLQGTFNNYKIQVEQNTVRALSFLNSGVITNRLQMYRNILSTFKKILARDDISRIMNVSQIEINSAYEIANNGQINFQENRSMWYSPNITSMANPTAAQQKIYTKYLQTQRYIYSIFSNKDDIYSPIKNIRTIFTHQDQHFIFIYPSQNLTQYSTPNTPVLDSSFKNTIQNYNDENVHLNATVFDEGEYIRICTIFYFGIVGVADGVVCMDLRIEILVRDITSVMSTPEFQLSTNDYYFVRPLYKFQGLTNPQIIANFSSNNLSKINIPIKQYLSLQKTRLPAQIFKGDRPYNLSVLRLQQTKTYYTIPISTLSTGINQQIMLYLIVANNFAKAQFAAQSRSERIAVIMIVPSAVLLFVSILITTLVLRSIFKKLDLALKMMENYCSLIKRGDLQLQIPEYTQAEDLKQLFKQLSKLNQLNKYANYQYFNVPKPERIIRLLKCMKLFESLNYDLTSLYENICECYVELGDIEKALEILRIAINKTIRQLYGQPEQIEKVYEKKLAKLYKTDKNKRKIQKVLRRMILRLCQILYMSHTGIPGQNNQIQNEITEMAELLRKITYPDILNFQYIGCFMLIITYEIRNGNFQATNQKIQTLYELLKGYQQVNFNNDNIQTPPEIMFSYYHSIKGLLFMAEQKYVEAFQHVVKSLQGNRYNPQVHDVANPNLQRLLLIHNINKDQLRELKYFEQYKPRSKRQYIFLIDVSKPEMSINDVNRWKKKARAMADFIFTKHIQDTDRVSITQFCLDIKIVCNLIEKGNRDKMLKKQLSASMKVREQKIIASVIPCLKKSLERVKHLKNEKIFLIFLKQGYEIYAEDIIRQFRQASDSKIVLFLENTFLLQGESQDIFAFQYDNFEDVDRILEVKRVKTADNIIYIF